MDCDSTAFNNNSSAHNTSSSCYHSEHGITAEGTSSNQCSLQVQLHVKRSKDSYEVKNPEHISNSENYCSNNCECFTSDKLTPTSSEPQTDGVHSCCDKLEISSVNKLSSNCHSSATLPATESVSSSIIYNSDLTEISNSEISDAMVSPGFEYIPLNSGKESRNKSYPLDQENDYAVNDDISSSDFTTPRHHHSRSSSGTRLLMQQHSNSNNNSGNSSSNSRVSTPHSSDNYTSNSNSTFSCNGINPSNSSQQSAASNTPNPFTLINRFKRKRENRASTFALQHNARPLIGEFGGCPWKSQRERYDLGVVG